jgi:CHAD domain-containing protein
MEERKEITLRHPPRTDHEPARSPGTTSAANEWGKVRKLALRHLHRFVSLEPKVLKGDDPDAIHDMRVASRRLQQVLDLIFPKPQPREARRLRRTIRRCRRGLGEVRNCDVLLELVTARLGRKRCPDREAWSNVKQHIEERRSRNSARAVRKLSKMDMAVFHTRAKEVLDRLKPAAGGDHPEHPSVQPEKLFSEPFPARLAQALAGVWSDFEKQVAASRRDTSAPSIHAARIAAKRLRYLLEFVNQFAIPGSSVALSWLKKIQQHLGDWHDMEVLEEMVIDMIAKPEFLRDHLLLALAIEKLILRNRDTKRGFREKYFRMTQDSATYQGIKIWVEGFLAAPSLPRA